MSRLPAFFLRLSFACALMRGAVPVMAQDIHFSQFYENSMLRNPALTGIFSGDYKLGANYRNQWNSLSVPYQTLMAAAEGRYRINRETNDYLSYGLTFAYDKAAAISFNSMEIMPAINFNKSLEDAHGSYLSAGVGVGYIERSFDPSRVTTNSQYVNGGFDPNASTDESFVNNKLRHFDLNLGVSLNSSIGRERQSNYYLGVAAYHLLRPRQSFSNDPGGFSRLTPKFTGQAGFSFKVSSQIGFVTHFNYIHQQPYQEWISGGMAFWQQTHPTDRNKNLTLYGGVFYRGNDALIPTFKMEYGKYAFTTSYDVTTSSLRQANGGAGGMEVSFYVRGFFLKSRDIMDQMVCPRFELLNGSEQE